MGVDSDRKYCTQCGSANRKTAKICTACGYRFRRTVAAQPTEEHCPQCNTLCRTGAKFCSRCGYRFTSLTESPIVGVSRPAIELPVELNPPDMPPPTIDEADILDGEPALPLTPEEFEALRRSKDVRLTLRKSSKRDKS